MSVMTVCEGCGKPDPSTMRVGTIDPLEYCETCAIVVVGFIESRDALHEKIATRWETELEKLKQHVMKQYPEMNLPDV